MNTSNHEINFSIKHHNYIMRDHIVHGVSMLPGVVLLDVIHRLVAKNLRFVDITLYDITFLAPIVTSKSFDQSVTVHLNEAGAREYSVVVRAAKAHGDESRPEAPITIMECRMVREDSPARASNFDIDSFVEGADRSWDMDDAYGMVRSARIVHGEFMKALGTLYHRGGQALAHLRLSALAEQHRGSFMAHPVFLDAATSLQFSFRLADSGAARDAEMDAYIPFSIRQFRIHRPLPAQVYVLASPRNASADPGRIPDVVSTDIQIFDSRGRLLVDIGHATGKRIRERKTVEMLVADEVSSKRGAKTRIATSLDVRGVIRSDLLEKIESMHEVSADEFDDDTPFYDIGLDSSHLLRLTKLLEERCACNLYPTFLFEYKTIGEVTEYLHENHSAAFAGLGGENLAIPSVDSDVETASGTLHDKNRRASATPSECVMIHPTWEYRRAGVVATKEQFRRVVVVRKRDKDSLHLGRRAVGGRKLVVVALEDDDMATGFSDLTGHLFLIVQQLFDDKSSPMTFVQVLLPSDEVGNVLSGVLALLRVAHAENPKLVGQVIQFEPGCDPAQLGEMLAAEAPCVDLIRLGSNGRSVQVWKESTAVERKVPWRNHATYLITGGAGGLGLLLARFIAEATTGTMLFLCGRSSTSPSVERGLAELRALGCEVEYVRADVSDQVRVNQLVDEIVRRRGNLHGVVHAAGLVRDGFLRGKPISELAEVLAPKVRGTLNLDQATRACELDFFVLFSSLASALGSPGQADYAAGNAFMDGFAEAREGLRMQGLRRGRTLAINWPLWQEGGMQVDELTRRSMWEDAGMLPMSSASGLDALYRAFGTRNVRCAFAEGDPARLRSQLWSRLGVSTSSAPLQGDPDLRRSGDGPLDVAIIGLSGAYPGAADLSEFWDNLAAGRDCVSEVPKERWDWRDYYTQDRGEPGRHHCKWGGFMSGVEDFDARFFHMSPREAEFIDPQERLFVEHAWRAMEDAGYRRKDLQGGSAAEPPAQVGVYAGVMFNEYQLFGAEASARGTPMGFSSSIASIANRVSYLLDLHGPSITLDTMCSGALTGLHLACRDLQSGRVDMAFAGGVNLTIHPNKYLMLSAAQFIAPEGKCASFGIGGEGYVPGEGVGVVVLKRLEDAERDGDHIYGVIKGIALNHGGKANGFSVPSPKAQEMVVAKAVRESDIDPRTISYVEAHGTGTKLGDPIEIRALTGAFATDEKQFCRIGSVKSNIGHCEAAAGIAGLTKVLLQMQKATLVPSLHSSTLNPHIDFSATPFIVNQQRRPWDRPTIDGAEVPRRAGVSSFGAGGSNAHLIVEEYVAPTVDLRSAIAPTSDEPWAIVLSARTPNQVRIYARDLLARLKRTMDGDIDMRSLAYTLQIGREYMASRMGLLVRTREELMRALERVSADDAPQSPHGFASVGALASNDGLTIPARFEGASRVSDLLHRWLRGETVDWHVLYTGAVPRRMSLPTYPFERTRYWAPDRIMPRRTVDSPATIEFRSSGPARTISI